MDSGCIQLGAPLWRIKPMWLTFIWPKPQSYKIINLSLLRRAPSTWLVVSFHQLRRQINCFQFIIFKETFYADPFAERQLKRSLQANVSTSHSKLTYAVELKRTQGFGSCCCSRGSKDRATAFVPFSSWGKHGAGWKWVEVAALLKLK